MLNRLILAGSAALLAMSVPAAAQMATETTGNATSADIGVAPLPATAATDYVVQAAAADQFEIQSSRLAATKSSRADVKGYAKTLVAHHTATSKTLMAALRNNERTIARPSTKLNTEQAANLALLKKAPKAGFDNLYLTQQVQAHQQAWALHKGYALNGTDPALKQVAATAVPVIEQHFVQAKALAGATLAN